MRKMGINLVVKESGFQQQQEQEEEGMFLKELSLSTRLKHCFSKAGSGTVGFGQVADASPATLSLSLWLRAGSR